MEVRAAVAYEAGKKLVIEKVQLEGPKAFEAQLRVVAADADVNARVLRVVPTRTGFVLEHEEEARAWGRAGRAIAERLTWDHVVSWLLGQNASHSVR